MRLCSSAEKFRGSFWFICDDPARIPCDVMPHKMMKLKDKIKKKITDPEIVTALVIDVFANIKEAIGGQRIAPRESLHNVLAT